MTLTELRSATTPAAPRALPAHTPAPPADQTARQSREPRAAPLSLRCVTKRWRGARAAVLDRVTLALEPATMTWIGGRNGVGKTTLLRIAAGLIEPDTGEVEVWGESARENRVRYQRLVSLLAAGDRGLYARLSVRGHLDFCARIAMLPRSELQRAENHSAAEHRGRGAEHDHRTWRFAHQLPERLHPVHARHLDVKRDDVGIELGDLS